MLARPAVVFDVNETLLDLATLRLTFERIFDGAELRSASHRCRRIPRFPQLCAG
jgi:hypothetical protein